MLKQKAQLVATCVDSYTPEHVADLHDMYEHDREITYKTFARHVDIAAIARRLGYAYRPGERGVRLSRDYCVQFYRSTWQGKTCYHMDWSAIDHVFQ